MYLGLQLDGHLLFHAHVDYIFSQTVRTLGVIRTVIFYFFALPYLLLLYLILVRLKVVYVTIVTSTDARKLEHFLVSLCQNHFLSQDHVT
jgi:hypothetical protein